MVAGILLAAGSATRMGRNKLLLEMGGEPMVRRVARRALEGGLDPLLVVVGHEEPAIRAALSGLPCRLVPCPEWHRGQSASLAAGVGAVPVEAGAAVEEIAAGFYNIRLVHYEAGGGDAVELTARQGSFTGWDTNFKLVGDTLNGGLLTYTKMPTAGQSATVTVTVTGVNDAPVAGTVAAQTISEGSPVTFTMVGASDVDAGTTLSYQWDLDNNGSF